MRYLLLIVLSLAGITIWQGCKTTKHALGEYEGPKLIFGSGGGFIGSVQEFILLPNGQLFVSQNHGEAVEQPKIKKRIAKKFFKKVDEMGLLNVKYKKPGNMYYFLGYQKEDKKSKAVWGREPQLINAPLDSLYRELLQVLPKIEAKSDNTESK